MIRVLLADDHSIVRAGLRRIVEESGDMEVVAEAADGRGAVLQARDCRPDVAVVDISMPELDGLEVTAQLQAEMPDLPIIILTMHEEDQYVVRAIEAGAMGYITKKSAPEQLVKAIRRVRGGRRYLSAEAMDALALRVALGDHGRSPLDSLSRRELQVLRRLAMGHTNRKSPAPTTSASRPWTPTVSACSKNSAFETTPTCPASPFSTGSSNHKKSAL